MGNIVHVSRRLVCNVLCRANPFQIFQVMDISDNVRENEPGEPEFKVSPR